MSPLPAILPRLRAAGGDATMRDGKLVLQHASLLPTALVSEARARRDDLLAELANDNARPDPLFVDDPIKRAAIQAEAIPKQRITSRPASWARPDDAPAPSDYCGACKSSLWWIENETPKGWRCCWCHPPAHIQVGNFRALAT